MDGGPDSEPPPAARGRALETLTRPLAVAGGLLSLAAAAMVVTSVLLRWLTVHSVPGDIELVQIATGLSIFAFLPLCQAQRGNIMVDTFTTWLPARAQRGLDALWDVVYACAAAVIAWRLAVGAADTIRSHTVSMMLGLPIGWVIAACAVMAALLMVVALATAWRLVRGRR
ncbi:MAG: TRAP transporter small permease [Variibacter sp.]|nr:TRAP transporter small permease [Variibacter sp.]